MSVFFDPNEDNQAAPEQSNRIEQELTPLTEKTTEKWNDYWSGNSKDEESTTSVVDDSLNGWNEY